MAARCMDKGREEALMSMLNDAHRMGRWGVFGEGYEEALSLANDVGEEIYEYEDMGRFVPSYLKRAYEDVSRRLLAAYKREMAERGPDAH